MRPVSLAPRLKVLGVGYAAEALRPKRFDRHPVAEAETFLRAHPDLYREDRGGVRLAIRGGRISLGSLDCAGFGTSVVPDLSSTSPMPRADWPTGSFETVVAGPAPS
jgi:hypothetical protein